MRSADDRPRRRWPHVMLALWSALVLALLIWPAYDWLGNRVEPRVLGLPLSFAWNGLLAVATFGVLALYYFLTEPRSPRTRDEAGDGE